MESVYELRIPELVGAVDLTDYPGMGLDLSRVGDFEGTDFIVLSIMRIGDRLSPIGYLRPFPGQTIAVEVDEGYVVGLEFNREAYYPQFFRALSEGEINLLASYIIVTDSGTNLLWFRRFPRTYAGYFHCNRILPYIAKPIDFYYAYVERSGSLFEYVQKDAYGCFPLTNYWKICLEHLRVSPDGSCAPV